MTFEEWLGLLFLTLMYPVSVLLVFLILYLVYMWMGWLDY